MFVHWSVLCPTHTGVCQPVLQIITIISCLLFIIVILLLFTVNWYCKSSTLWGWGWWVKMSVEYCWLLVLFVNLSLAVCINYGIMRMIVVQVLVQIISMHDEDDDDEYKYRWNISCSICQPFPRSLQSWHWRRLLKDKTRPPSLWTTFIRNIFNTFNYKKSINVLNKPLSGREVLIQHFQYWSQVRVC